jgi:ammonium transporter Rh
MIAGFIVGSISAFGFSYLSAFVKKHLLLHDTCGVLNLHGIPGVIGGLLSSIMAYRAPGNFGSNLATEYPLQSLRTGPQQAGYQLAGLGVCLGIAIGSGLLTGFITSREWF